MSVIGYRFVSDGAFSEKQREMIMADSKVREVMNVLTDNEIRDVIRNKVDIYLNISSKLHNINRSTV